MVRKTAVQRIDWRPAGAYALTVEVMRIAQLRRKESPDALARPQSLQFFGLIGVTRGRTRHRIDFRPIEARPGTWMLQRPGQLQQYDFARAWDGWLIVFRPDALPPRGAAALGALDALIEALPPALQLPPAAHARCCEAAARMAADARRVAGAVDAGNALLLHELGALLARLQLAAPPRRAAAPRADGDRLRRLAALVAADPHARRSVPWYAERLHCSARTLGRAVRDASGLPVKAWLDQALALEARRLLVHGGEPIKRVADRLGFVDAGNFVKFFKRVVGSTPAAFRDAQGAPPA